MNRFTRRGVFGATMGFSLYGLVHNANAMPINDNQTIKFKAVEPKNVRLNKSIYLDAIEANRKYLLSLSADSLLHYFHFFAGIEPKGEHYGGWENLGIAGHSLGHYQSACSLMFAQTGDVELKRRAIYISQELKQIQNIYKDGYAGGSFVERNGKKLNAKIIFDEINEGNIYSGGFDLNGGWVPIYTYHKVIAGVIDCYKICNDYTSLEVAIGLGNFLGRILEKLDDAQMQKVLASEHGGINESFAELYSITKNEFYLKIAKKIRHTAIIEPIATGKDILDGKHANTQIPKFIGLASIFENTNDPQYAKTAMLFWDMVVKDHSYVIGGNSNREHFGPARQLSKHLDQQTCEACNTYNMLKLTKKLYSWTGDSSYFDYYERAHNNHIMSQIRPSDGAFTYFTPLAPGFKRVHSHPTNDFWCCVGSGMESHSKHGESIYWHYNDTLIINLYYASQLKYPEKSINLRMDTNFPHDEKISITINQIGKKNDGISKFWLRIPNWCKHPKLTINGVSAKFKIENNYIKITQTLRNNDKLELMLPMQLHFETMPDDENIIAALYGPLVLAADLGTTEGAWDLGNPVVIGKDFQNRFRQKSNRQIYYDGQTFPENLVFKPFYNMHDNKSAVYYRNASSEEWAEISEEYKAAAIKKAKLEAATIDVIYLGEMQSERDHKFDGTPNTAAVSHISLKGRLLNKGYLKFALRSLNVPMLLQVTYAGRDRNRNFDIRINDKQFVIEKLEGEITNEPLVKTYPISQEYINPNGNLLVEFAISADQWASVYECRLLKQEYND